MDRGDTAASWASDVYQYRDVERRLTQLLQVACERLRLCEGVPEERQVLKREYEQALQRFTNFAKSGTIPDDLHS